MFSTVVYKQLRYEITPDKIISGVVLLLLIIVGFVFHFMYMHKKSERSLSKSYVFYGLIISLLALALGGAFYPGQTFGKVAIVLGVGLVFLFIYIMLIKCTSDNIKNVVVKSIVAFGLIIVYQMLYYFIQSPYFLEEIQTKTMVLGWAVTNSTAQILAFCIPMCFYLSFKNSKATLLWQILAFVFLCFVCLTNCRSMIVASIFVYIVCSLIAVIKFPSVQLITVLLCTIGISVVLALNFSDIIFSQFERLGLSNNGRTEQNTWYIETFKEHPIFGMGCLNDTEFQSDGVVRVHNTALQILTSFGLFGVVCFIPYFFQRYKALLTNFSVFKLFACVSYITYVAYGLVDTGFISFYKTILVYLIVFVCEVEPTIGQEKFAKGLFPKQSEKQKIEKNSDFFVDESNVVKHWLYRNVIKRTIDFILAFVAIILLSPILLLLAVIVRVKNGNPIIFTQYRVGKDNKIFKFIKFRSMSNKKDSEGNLLPDSERLSSFGKKLRATSLDELPQLFSILIGKMSFIGPRPRDVKEYVFFNEEQAKRHRVKPGITGWAQVNGRNNINFEQVAELDNYYVENMNLFLDIKIFFLTFVTIFKKTGIEGQVKANNENEYYGDYLLRLKKISKQVYDEKIEQAKEISKTGKM